MLDALTAYAREDRDSLYAFLTQCFALERPYLARADLVKAFEAVRRNPGKDDLGATPLGSLAHHSQEGFFHRPWAHFALRERVGLVHHLRIHLEQLVPEGEGIRDYLAFQESLVPPARPADQVLEVDLGPFGRRLPRLTETRSIGKGLLFLNRHLTGQLLDARGEGLRRLLEFLSLHSIDRQQLLITPSFPDVGTLRVALRRALGRLERVDEATPWAALADSLGKAGFAPGWGATAGRVAETMSLLVDILEAPSPAALETFLARIPMISRLLIVSPHGYFGQDNVLGLPDTGGQVTYILDQVRALESEMRDRLLLQGVAVEPRILVATRLIPECGETTCDQRLERILGTAGAAILRIPFSRPTGEVVQPWISRFEVWPYLEQFARDLEREALAELGGRPDLVVGNYSDGNLVASLVSRRLGVTQCNIAHALEINKYPFSALAWREYEEPYHFSVQYTADLISMNTADFIVTSTFQEIAGTDAAPGQYESFNAFSMPGLYRVVDGIDPFDPRFNVVSPGADAEVYFPAAETDRRPASLRSTIDDLVYGAASTWARGTLEDREKPLLFTMARLDRIKNVTGLVEWYGRSERLRRAANLLVVAGTIDSSASADAEERAQIVLMHRLLDEHRLDGQVRWVGRRLEKTVAGELYRYVADRRGVFVQPALFEAFGLTVIEAMATGLPTFATCHGGPSEIVEPNRSGFSLDPGEGEAAAAEIAAFLERCKESPAEWDRISAGAVARVRARYTWKLYAERIMTFSRIYGFWKFVSGLEREETARYLHMFYQLQFRPLAAGMARTETAAPAAPGPVPAREAGPVED